MSVLRNRRSVTQYGIMASSTIVVVYVLHDTICAVVQYFYLLHYRSVSNHDEVIWIPLAEACSWFPAGRCRVRQIRWGKSACPSLSLVSRVSFSFFFFFLSDKLNAQIYTPGSEGNSSFFLHVIKTILFWWLITALITAFIVHMRKSHQILSNLVISYHFIQ